MRAEKRKLRRPQRPRPQLRPPAEPAAGVATAGAPASGTWTPEALEELAAPIALYPDVVLGHVLAASTNPQEVLDAGNWLIAHQDLTGSALDKEAAKLGLSPSTRALLQFPETVDMMCMQMDWTTQLGQAFTADQGAVLDAVQRLRTQAKDVGNLESSKQLKVETETQEGKEVVTVAPADPQVVYVPKYDPEAVYAPPPATIPPPTTINITPAPGTTITTSDGQVATTTAAPTTTTTTTTTTEEKGHSTGALVTTGLLAFGAGLLVNEVFDDDDDWDDYYPNYGHGGMYYGGGPYYPPPPYMYRPPYGGGYYPSNGYNRPPNYQHGFNNNTIIVNNGGNDYWKRNGSNSTRVDTRPAKSPITAAKPNRSELNDLNRQASDRARTQAQRPDTRQAQPNQARQTGYAGARPENKAARDKMVQNSPKPAGVSQDLPKRPQGTYAGAKDRPAASQRPAAAKPATREPPKQLPGGATDRGRGGAEAARPSASRPDLARDKPASTPARPEAARERPATQTARVDQPRPSSAQQRSGGGAFNASSAKPARAEHAASQRGRSSKPSGAKSSGAHSGGGKRPGR